MDNSNENDLKIYRRINELINECLVTNFEDDLLYFLSSHTDKSNNNIKNFLNGLKSFYSISKCFRFSRYLALGIKEPFHLYEGKLSNLCNGDFSHAWIETNEYVYDVSFIGKWPKYLYYRLFNPIVEKDIDLNIDPKFLEYKSNCIETLPQEKIPFLRYIDWYTYILHISRPNPYISNTPSWFYFPQDLERKRKLDFLNFIQNKWISQSKISIDKIPSELFSEELSKFIEQENYLKEKNYLMSELIKFITNNYELYEEKKEKEYDLTLWKKAIEGKYSGSFCLLISNIPKVLFQIKENQENKNTNKL